MREKGNNKNKDFFKVEESYRKMTNSKLQIRKIADKKTAYNEDWLYQKQKQTVIWSES